MSEEFKQLDVAVNNLYFDIICQRQLKSELLQKLLVGYTRMSNLMSLNNNYFAICTRMDAVQSLLIDTGLLKKEKQAGTR